MVFKQSSSMGQKREFVALALAEGANVSALCRRFGIGRTIAYKLLGRYRAEGIAGLDERSREPKASPARVSATVEAAVVALRQRHPAWGGRKIAKRLAERAQDSHAQDSHAQDSHAVAPSTVTGILRRNGIELGRFGGGHKAFIRFEHAAPNDLWQMDFKGHVALQAGRLHPLTVLDDHSRYALTISACGDETAQTVKTALISTFRRYGLPQRMAMDNGPPWGDRGGQPFTVLTVWLIETGIAISHSTPCHPQTLGKDERFHRSLKAEALSGPPFASLDKAQRALDDWRMVYHHERPHEALDLCTPVTRYRPSTRRYSDIPPAFDYATNDIVRKVQHHGFTHLLGQIAKLPKAFNGKQVAFRPTQKDGVYDAYFRHQKIKTIDLANDPK
jgi:transposase InsO family protein